VDYPLVKTETIDFLIKKFEEEKPLILLPGLQARKGHPPIFSASLKKEFLALHHDEGLNIIQRRYQEKVVFCEVADAGVRASFNTKEELKDFLKT
jgi:CTP:molybdopterin cytidylyltransferase MocA